MERGAGLSKAFDLVLDHQFPALEFHDAKIIGGQMQQGIVQFCFENLVLAFQFDQMRLKCHSKTPRVVEKNQFRIRLDDEVYMTVDICRWVLKIVPPCSAHREKRIVTNALQNAGTGWLAWTTYSGDSYLMDSRQMTGGPSQRRS